MGAECVGSHERFGDLVRKRHGKSAADINGSQFPPLTLRMRLEFLSLLVKVGSLSVSLRADGYVFAGGHGHCSGDQCGDRSREHEACRGSRCNYTDCNAGDRNNSVICTEYGGS